MRGPLNVLAGKTEGSVYCVGRCVFSNKEYSTAEFPRSALEAYKKGAYIQNALEMLSEGDREFILSGICPEAFDTMFPKK